VDSKKNLAGVIIATIISLQLLQLLLHTSALFIFEDDCVTHGGEHFISKKESADKRRH
jgi:hypothetical protein